MQVFFALPSFSHCHFPLLLLAPCHRTEPVHVLPFPSIPGNPGPAVMAAQGLHSWRYRIAACLVFTISSGIPFSCFMVSEAWRYSAFLPLFLFADCGLLSPPPVFLWSSALCCSDSPSSSTCPAPVRCLCGPLTQPLSPLPSSAMNWDPCGSYLTGLA